MLALTSKALPLWHKQDKCRGERGKMSDILHFSLSQAEHFQSNNKPGIYTLQVLVHPYKQTFTLDNVVHKLLITEIKCSFGTTYPVWGKLIMQLAQMFQFYHLHRIGFFF